VTPGTVRAISVLGAAFFAGAFGAETGVTRSSDEITRVRLASLEADTQLWYASDVVPPSAGKPWAVVGHVVNRTGVRTPVAWSSPDGIGWSRNALPASPSPGRDAAVVAVAGHGVTAAFGSMNVGTGNRPIGWTKRGASWSFATELTNLLLPLRQVTIDGAVADRTGFVAVGGLITADSSRAVILESADARSWRSIEQPDLVAPPDSAVQLSDLGVNGDRVLAVGGHVARRIGGPPRTALAFLREGGRWSRIPSSAFGPGVVYLNSLVTRDKGFVAVGARQVGARVVATAWASSDGRTWRASAEGAFAPKRARESSIFAMGRLGGVYLAIGQIDLAQTAWLSSDGRRWHEIPIPTAMRNFGLASFVRIGATATTLVVVLRTEEGSQLWRLADGRWRQVGVGRAFPFRGAAVEVTGTAVSGGRAVAVGGASVAKKGEARVWARTANGWTTGTLPSAKSAALTSVAGIPGGFVAGGLTTRGGRFAAALWRSTDGRAWTRASVPASSPGVDNAVQAVVWDGRRAIAVVNDVVRRPPTKRITLWSSKDGRFWRRLASVAKGQVGAKGVCVGPAAFLVVGGVRVGNFERAAVWQKAGERWRRVLFGSSSQMRSCAVGGREVVVVGADRGHATTWLWTATASWQQARQVGDLLPSDPPRVMEAVAATSTGFIAVGGDGARGQYDLGLWISTDGYQWRLVRNGDRAFQETGHQQATAVAVDDRGRLVLGGRSIGSGALWEGTIPTP
jgi:hypothetical protein